MEKTLSYLTILPSNARELKVFIDRARQEILTNDDPLLLLAHLKWAEKTIHEILDDKEIKEKMYSEATKYNQDIFVYCDQVYAIGDEESKNVNIFLG
jgi:hypothetical protein